MESNTSPSHFKGKDAIGHVAEAMAEGIISVNEIHGTETPGRISAAADAARDCSLFLMLAWAMLVSVQTHQTTLLTLLAIISLALIVWKAGRSGWLGWSRLERLHRVLSQEKWEIENNRQQERDELRVIYEAKGFEGKFLEDVLDVLMADGNRLLKVMVDEELGLSLEAYDHPLTQSLGAALGALAASIVCLLGFYIYPTWGLPIAGAITIATAAAIAAAHAGNQMISAVVWNLGLTALSFGTLYFLIDYFLGIPQ